MIHSGNLSGRGPLGLKAPKPERRTKAARNYMARVAVLRCVCCGHWPIEVHHCISGRFGSRKASDFDTIPLCFNHHRGPDGIHTNKAAWEATYGLDTDYLPIVADMLAGHFNTPWKGKNG